MCLGSEQEALHEDGWSLTSVKQDEMVVDTPLRSHLAFLIIFTLGGKCSLHNSENRVVVERRAVEGKKYKQMISF